MREKLRCSWISRQSLAACVRRQWGCTDSLTRGTPISGDRSIQLFAVRGALDEFLKVWKIAANKASGCKLRNLPIGDTGRHLHANPRIQSFRFSLAAFLKCIAACEPGSGRNECPARAGASETLAVTAKLSHSRSGQLAESSALHRESPFPPEAQSASPEANSGGHIYETNDRFHREDCWSRYGITHPRMEMAPSSDRARPGEAPGSTERRHDAPTREVAAPSSRKHCAVVLGDNTVYYAASPRCVGAGHDQSSKLGHPRLR